MKKLHVTEVCGIREGTWLWCLHCERCYQAGEYREMDEGLQMCPYDDCDGSTVFDGWRWSRVRRENPGYPMFPERNKVYPLYQ
jgi:hypothetical protein